MSRSASVSPAGDEQDCRIALEPVRRNARYPEVPVAGTGYRDLVPGVEKAHARTRLDLPIAVIGRLSSAARRSIAGLPSGGAVNSSS